MRCGYISIVGRPNSGKSTLLNKILDMDLSIVSDLFGTTQNLIKGIYQDEDSQLIFIDTPGITKAMNKLGRQTNASVYDSLEMCDLILFLVDSTTNFGQTDKFILNKIKETNKNAFLILTKIDKIKDKTKIINKINELKNEYNFSEIIPISSIKNTNIKDLIETTKKYLKEQDPIYEKDEITDASMRFIVSEIVRLSAINNTYEEVPHKITTKTIYYKETDNKLNVSVDIIVDRANLKPIILGKQGKNIKKIGIEAREKIEDFIGKHTNLETHVLVKDNWQNDERYLKEEFYEDRGV